MCIYIYIYIYQSVTPDKTRQGCATRLRNQKRYNFQSAGGAYTGDAVLRRIGLFASRCFFFGLDAKFRRESASEDNFYPIEAQCATRAGNLRQLCTKVWRADCLR